MGLIKCLYCFYSDSFKKILMCLSGVAIKLQEGEYDAEPPSAIVRFACLSCVREGNPGFK